MKVIRQIAHDACQITIFWWNQKYLLKFEKNNLEQTYKLNELDFLEEDVLRVATNQTFIAKVLERFKTMQQDLSEIITQN